MAAPLLCWATRSAMDSAGACSTICGACLLFLTLSAMDLDATTLDLRIGVGATSVCLGNLTIDQGGSLGSKHLSSLAPRSNSTLGDGGICTLGGCMVSGGLPGCTCSFCIRWHHSAACSIGNCFKAYVLLPIIVLLQFVHGLLHLNFLLLYL